MGSLVKGFLRKVHGNSAETSRKSEKYVVLHQERVRKFCGKFAEFCGNLRTIFCNDPFPNGPISELLIKGVSNWMVFIWKATQLVVCARLVRKHGS